MIGRASTFLPADEPTFHERSGERLLLRPTVERKKGPHKPASRYPPVTRRMFGDAAGAGAKSDVSRLPRP